MTVDVGATLHVTTKSGTGTAWLTVSGGEREIDMPLVRSDAWRLRLPAKAMQ